ncbi:MAG: hypothetical protein LBS23_03640 [Holosporaceae bacterium]|jgi:hypothetical protein|nr:hypothetical protein [Holosporaceae bacterium]
MKKMFAFLGMSIIFASSCNASLIDITDKRSEYVGRLNGIREVLFGDDSISVCCKAKLAAVCAELSKEETDFRQVISNVFSVLPEVSDNDGVHLLNKIAVLSAFHLLKKGVYDFIGASFCPEEEDLSDIKIEGQSTTPSDFREIQDTLLQKLETTGSLPDTSDAFEDVVKAIVKRRPRSAPESMGRQVRPKSADARLRAKTTDDL